MQSKNIPLDVPTILGIFRQMVPGGFGDALPLKSAVLMYHLPISTYTVMLYRNAPFMQRFLQRLMENNGM